MTNTGKTKEESNRPTASLPLDADSSHIIKEADRLAIDNKNTVPEEEGPAGLPTVAVCVCRYREPVDDLIRTVECMYRIQWPGHKLQLFILDDGWYSADEEKQREQMMMLAELLEVEDQMPGEGVPEFETCQGLSRPDCATESN